MSEMVHAERLMAGVHEAGSDAFMDALDPVLPDGFRLAYGLLRNVDDAADAIQEATISAWRHRRSFRAGSPVRPWFLAIVANQCRRAVRDKWWSVLKRSELTTTTSDGDPTEIVAGASIRRILNRLNERDRLVLVLRYYLDLPFDEVAATLRISPGAARVRVHRAVERLKLQMSGEEELP